MSAPWPRLSETLPFPRDPLVCQSCGLFDDCGRLLHRWREHDDSDLPTPVVVVLCAACAEGIIEPHPRLYGRMHPDEPLPGAMALCVDCSHRDGLRCTHPDLTANGGPGLRVSFPKPGVMFLDGVRNGRRCGWQQVQWHGPPTKCAGRSEIHQEATR